MIKCLAIDDEPLSLQQIASYIQRVPFLELIEACPSAARAQAVMEQNPIDVLFIDINMPDLNGMDFVKQLDFPPMVVFTTAYSEYAVEGFKVNAVDYLLKPFGFDEFKAAAIKVKERMEMGAAKQPSIALEETDNTLFLKSDYRLVKINPTDVRYIEGMSEYLRIYVDGQAKPIIVLMSMKKMEENLPSFFIRIHRSYIININRIQEINKGRVGMGGDVFLPIGELYKDALNDYVNSHFLGK